MTAPAPTPLVRRPGFWVVIVAVFLAVAVALAVGIAVSGTPGGGDAAATRTARPTPATTAVPIAVPPATPAAPGPVIPADCSGIYTKDWTPEMHGLVLNPPWTLDAESGVRYGSKDTGLISVLEATEKVTCVWGNPNGGSDSGGLTTNVAAITSEQSADVIAHMKKIGYSCYEELAGTRCVVETPGDNGTVGESHFIREGIWSATWWLNVSPDGYTHDIVTAIFGA